MNCDGGSIVEVYRGECERAVRYLVPRVGDALYRSSSRLGSRANGEIKRSGGRVHSSRRSTLGLLIAELGAASLGGVVGTVQRVGARAVAMSKRMSRYSSNCPSINTTSSKQLIGASAEQVGRKKVENAKAERELNDDDMRPPAIGSSQPHTALRTTMTSRKPRRNNNTTNNHGNNHQNQPSHYTDYESDAAYLSDMHQQAAPPLRSNEEINLAVLRRHNPSITSILSLAQYAVVYIFSPTTRQWEKNGVEGTLFVCQLSQGNLGEERYCAFVLNRRGLQNFDLPLTDGENVELTEEYVILKADESTEGDTSTNGIADPLNPQSQQNGSANGVRIYGLWIYSEPPPNSTAETRTINAQMIRECAVHAGQSLKLAHERLEAMRQNGMHVAAAAAETQTAPLAEVQASVPMGRQISLKDLFGQQRAQDDEWTVRAHHAGPMEQQQQHVPPPMPQQPPFPPPPMPMMFHQQQPPPYQPNPLAPQPPQQPDVLGDLFRRAGLAYGNGQGH